MRRDVAATWTEEKSHSSIVVRVPYLRLSSSDVKAGDVAARPFTDSALLSIDWSVLSSGVTVTAQLSIDRERRYRIPVQSAIGGGVVVLALGYGTRRCGLARSAEGYGTSWRDYGRPATVPSTADIGAGSNVYAVEAGDHGRPRFRDHGLAHPEETVSYRSDCRIQYPHPDYRNPPIPFIVVVCCEQSAQTADHDEQGQGHLYPSLLTPLLLSSSCDE